MEGGTGGRVGRGNWLGYLKQLKKWFKWVFDDVGVSITKAQPLSSDSPKPLGEKRWALAPQ